MLRALGNWRTTAMGVLGMLLEGIGQAKPALAPVVSTLQAFVFALIGYFAKDASTGSAPGATL